MTYVYNKTKDVPPSNAPTTGATPISVLHASCVPDIETWHHQLGHCNFGAIIDMACKYTIEGMAINLSSSPAKCDTCIRGKQTHTPVSKVREMERAKCLLEHVFLDMCGPIQLLSSSGHLYSMNMINGFSSYIWTIPLKSKDEAAPVLQTWHHTVKNQLGHHLRILVSDNGKLVSCSMGDWCAQFSIVHQ